MAHEDRPPAEPLSWLERLARDPTGFDFHVALRRLDASFPDKPRFGEAVRPADEGARLGQVPSVGFEPSAIARFEPPSDGSPARLSVNFFGLWGPQGPLPLHFTEYARDRIRHAGDRTLASFADIFHHRMLLLFHRAWARAQPTVALDGAADDRFASYLGAFFGLGMGATRNRDLVPDQAKLFFAGRFSSTTRNAEGLSEIVAGYFGLPATIEEFVGDWIDLPAEARWRLGASRETGTLGRTAVVGSRVWSRGHKFRIVLGPVSRFDFERVMPNSSTIAALAMLVRLYTNDEWDWDLRLVLAPEATEGMQLGRGARLGWTTRLGRTAGVREDLIVNPVLRRTRRAQSRPSSR
jgi:type VI secretion system protein ImpH